MLGISILLIEDIGVSKEKKNLLYVTDKLHPIKLYQIHFARGCKINKFNWPRHKITSNSE